MPSPPTSQVRVFFTGFCFRVWGLGFIKQDHCRVHRHLGSAFLSLLSALVVANTIILQ